MFFGLHGLNVGFACLGLGLVALVWLRAGLEFVSAVFAVDSICRVLCLAAAAKAGWEGSRDREGLTGPHVQVELVPAFTLEP